MRGTRSPGSVERPLRGMVLERFEQALDRPATDSERDLMLWLCPASAELRRLPAASALLGTPWEGVERAPGSEVGFLRLEGGGALAVAVDSRVHVDAASRVNLSQGVAATLSKLVAVGAQPQGLHMVVHCDVPEDERGQRGLRESIRSLSAHARERGVATLGAEVRFDSEYGDVVLVDCIALGWRPDEDTRLARRVPGVGDILVAAAGADLAGLRRDLVTSGLDCLALPTSSDVPLRAPISALGGLGLELAVAEPNSAPPDQILEQIRPDPTQSILFILPPHALTEVKSMGETRGVALAELGRISKEAVITVGSPSGARTVLPALAVREPDHVAAERTEPDDVDYGGDLALESLPEPEDYEDSLRRMLRAPNLSSRRELYERFDSFSGGSTVLHPGVGAGKSTFRIHGQGQMVTVANSGNPRFTALDPYVGFGIAVCEGVRRLATSGAEPRGLVGATSFGTSNDPVVRKRAEQGLAGLQDAARALSLPCLALTTSPAGPHEHTATPATPGLAFLGLLDRAPVTPWFKGEGHVIVLLGRSREEFGGSELACWLHGVTEGTPPWLDFEAEKGLQRVLSRSAAAGLLQSARTVSAGGVALAVVGACCGAPDGNPPIGARISMDGGMRPDAWLFAESQARALISVSREHVATVREFADEAEIPFAPIGETSRDVLEFGELIALTLDELLDVWNGALGERLGGI